MMSRFLLCSIFLCSFLLGKAQHFLYFESEAPFYVKAGDKTYTSGTQGFLLISGLQPNTMTLFIGISAEGSPKGTYTIEPSALDKGYELESGSRGLVLNDFNSRKVIHSPVYDLNVNYETREDPFTMMLARAVNDPSLLRIAIPALNKEEIKETTASVDPPKREDNKKEEEKVAEQAREINLADTAGVVVEKEVVTRIDSARVMVETTLSKTETVIPPDAPLPSEEYIRSTVRRYSESSTSEGFGLVYIIKTGEMMDTIRLVIPNPKITFSQDAEKPDESLFLPLGKRELDSLNKACVKAANDDFLSLRREMASQVSEGLMIKAAEVGFLTRCFSVAQIKSLGALFLDMEQRFLFFESAYKNVWDKAEFPTLSSELSGSDILERFQKLISR